MSEATLLRIRTLRRDRYRCQRRDISGRICGVPTSQIGRLGDDYVALCDKHMED